MINTIYGGVSLAPQLRQQLEKLLKGYSLPDNAKQLLLTCRQLSYYRHGRGIHPVEVQFQRTANSEPWQIVFFISFSYPFESALNVQPELYFHLAKGWCYQPDTGAVNLEHPEVIDLLQVWMKTFARHLSSMDFDEIDLSIVGK
ncbi:TPA: DUF2787 domain-containing protein [Vibrio parahaemolyticus]|uniref:DUF2787 family protein n=3 Tax=Vibrio parahaemolyticus TaxID=670 RepID=A0A227JGP9_VIBPH|nr:MULTISPECIES: DUF2787 family protein [Vibrio]MDW1809436.1 DUF2787 family protein [Vibrio sp. Vb2362]EGQ8193590.1 DUF2787 domain-containing protein [Vibrio parahaemolyticus]EGQ9304182.1 DUF2787 domain-containing protein [Vibrio parahaemolyticus]EGR0026296.1 DUF2787 domain-containing protein [Vibrio alginolyticus]EGR0403653.1 DUF2787 domain-containing protein [Vibrio parahaemolyticus]